MQTCGMGFCLLRTPTAAGGGARGGSSGVCESEGWRLRCYKQVQWLWARFISWVMVHSSGIVLLHVAAWVSDVFHFVTQLSPDHCHCVCCWSKKWWSVLLPCRTLSWQEGERATGNVLRPPPPYLEMPHINFAHISLVRPWSHGHVWLQARLGKIA